MLLKRTMKGELPLMAAAQKLQDEVLAFSAPEEESGGLLDRERKAVRNIKKIGLLTAGLALQKYMAAIEEEQEIMSMLSDIVMEAWAAESALLRTLKMADSAGKEKAQLYVLMTQLYINDAIGRVEERAKNVMAAISEGDMLRTNLAALKRFLKFPPLNTIEIRRKIADKMLESNTYPF
jgi:Acyl-CoA dehydrogenase, C-terminal domain